MKAEAIESKKRGWPLQRLKTGWSRWEDDGWAHFFGCLQSESLSNGCIHPFARSKQHWMVESTKIWKMMERWQKQKRRENEQGTESTTGGWSTVVWSGAAAALCRKGAYCFHTTQGRRKQGWLVSRGREGERDKETQPTGTHNGWKRGRQTKTDLAWFSFYWWPWSFIPFHSFVFFFLGLPFSLQQGKEKTRLRVTKMSTLSKGHVAVDWT